MAVCAHRGWIDTCLGMVLESDAHTGIYLLEVNVGYNLGKLLSWTCERCGQKVEPILGATFIKDKDGYRFKCLTCEPPGRSG